LIYLKGHPFISGSRGIRRPVNEIPAARCSQGMAAGVEQARQSAAPAYIVYLGV
jgi:hypothetical protein